MKERYRRGGLPDSAVKDRLIEVLLAFLKPIPERCQVFQKDPGALFSILQKGTEKAKEKASKTLSLVKTAMGIEYPYLYNRV